MVTVSAAVLVVQMNFWSELKSVEPSLLKLDAVAQSYEENSRKAEQAYEELLKLNPNSVTTLRQYARFLDEVCTTCALLLFSLGKCLGCDCCDAGRE